jgi:hypothetical protein
MTFLETTGACDRPAGQYYLTVATAEWRKSRIAWSGRTCTGFS